MYFYIVIKLKILDIFNSEDKDIKKIVLNKTTLEIVLLIFITMSDAEVTFIH